MEQTLQDITGPEAVEVRIRRDGKVVWLNVDGQCVFRVCRIKQLVVNDERTEQTNESQDTIDRLYLHAGIGRHQRGV